MHFSLWFTHTPSVDFQSAPSLIRLAPSIVVTCKTDRRTQKQCARLCAMTPPAAPAPRVKSDEADRIVLEFLRRRGYKSAENALAEQLSTTSPTATTSPTTASLSHAAKRLPTAAELAIDDAQIDDDLRNVLVLLRNPAELADSDVRRFEDTYCEFRDWVDGSLDIYKPQLHALLYPLLVHCYLEMVRRDHWKDARMFLKRCSPEFCEGPAIHLHGARRNEIVSLLAVASPQHVEENEIASLYLSHRYELYVSQYAFELILSFLADDPRRSVLLRILNQRCRLRCESQAENAPPAGLVKDGCDARRKVVGIVAEDETSGPPSCDILWGRLRPDHYIIPDDKEPKAPAKGKDKPKGKAGADAKGKAEGTAKKDSGEEEEEIRVRQDGTISASRVPLKRYHFGAPGLETVADLKARAKLRVADSVDGIRKDLSILFYTFMNLKDDGLNCSAVSDDGAQIAAGFGDSTVRVWDARGSGTTNSESGGLDGRAVRLVGHSGPVYSVDWSICGRFLLSGSEDGCVCLWHPAQRTNVVAYRGHNFPVWNVRWSPLDHYFASGSHDRTARVWTTDRTYPVRILAGHLADVDVVNWHPNCNYVATGSSDRTARLWDMRDGNCARVFHGDGGVHALAMAPDGRTLATGGDGAAIDIWDISSGRRMQQLKAHCSTVWSLAYSRDGAVLASGGADWRVCVWRAEDWCKTVIGRAHDSAANGNGTSSVAGGAAGVDGDGDVAMGVNEDGKGGEGGNGDADGMGGGDGEAKADGAGLTGEGCDVPVVEGFRTKQTPVQLVKFTRRNVLVATGSFGT